MAVSKAQQKAVHKYVKSNYDRMELTVPKGRKDEIKAHAATQGESVNGFIGRAIDETMERDRGGTPSEIVWQPPGTSSGAGVVSLPSEAIKAAQEAAEAAREGLPEFIGRAVTTQAQRDKLTRGMRPKQKAPGGTPEA